MLETRVIDDEDDNTVVDLMESVGGEMEPVECTCRTFPGTGLKALGMVVGGVSCLRACCWTTTVAMMMKGTAAEAMSNSN